MNDALEISALFPFHLELDSRLTIQGWGPAARKVEPGLAVGVALDESFELVRPRRELVDLEQLRDLERSILFFRHRTSGLRLRYQSIVRGERAYLIGAPVLSSLSDLERWGLDVRDFPPHDATGDFLFALQAAGTALEDSRRFAEKLSRQARELEEAKHQAEAANRAKTQFLATMGHEIRTPLNGVVSMAEMLLQSESVGGEDRECLEVVWGSAQTLQTLLNDLLDLSKIEAGQLELEAVPVSPAESVMTVTRLFAGGAELKGVELRAEVGSDAPAWIESDPARLAQILNNLVGNALKFTETGRIVVRVDRAEDGEPIEFTVTDTGIGVAPEVQPRLFEPFVQADSSVTRKYGGTGLGLSICRHLAQALGGEIALESEVGRGSRFSVRLPCRVVNPPRHAAASPTAMPTVSDIQLLVVDDYEPNRLIAAKILAKLGYPRVELAASGAEAVERVRNEAFDVVLMDLEMPEMGGLEATRMILAAPGPHPVIIALTAHALLEHREASFEAGMRGFVTKPLTMARLRAAIEEAVVQA